MSSVATTVSASQPAGSPAPAAAPAAAPSAATVDAAALQQRIAELEGQTADLQRANEFWKDKAKPAAAPAKPEEEPETDVLDLLTTKGAKGLDELLAKRGFVRKADVDAAVDGKAAQLTKEQELVGRYPDLKKKDSEFFKATALSYGDLVKNGTPQHIAMEIAAERTELEFMRSGKLKTPAQQADDTKAQKEADRLARIAAQGGDRGGRQPIDEGDDDAPLTAEQKHIARSMGISEEAYIARAKKGVSMKGIR